MRNIKSVEVTAKNESKISATVFFPSGEIIGSVVIASALGVEQSFYYSFASWLSNKGFVVTTFDYSSTGDSDSICYKKSNATITDWAKFDCEAILSLASSNAVGKPIYWMGHSLGGQIVGMIPNFSIVSKVITIASGSGYWKENVKNLKRRVWFLWYFVAPVLLKTFGYFPGKRIGMVGDLPYGVMHQWRKWCLHPNYFIGIEDEAIQASYQMFNTPITSFSFTDDQLMSEKNISSLHGFYGTSDKVMKRFSPEHLKTRSVGHFGFFKDAMKECLWEEHLLSVLSTDI